MSEPAEIPPLWRVGDVIDGRYEVTRVHEHGGMGLVYRVRHLLWGTDLAVKCPRPELFQSAADRERFVTEAEVWVSLISTGNWRHANQRTGPMARPPIWSFSWPGIGPAGRPATPTSSWSGSRTPVSAGCGPKVYGRSSNAGPPDDSARF
ncbi:MAG TPA: hypothetical protein VM347_34945 [Nonomuraea sp.]|nr:hypothetical protein [Nonomuraea sp.]